MFFRKERLDFINIEKLKKKPTFWCNCKDKSGDEFGILYTKEEVMKRVELWLDSFDSNIIVDKEIYFKSYGLAGILDGN